MRRTAAPLLLALCLSGPSQAVPPGAAYRILINHLGYDARGSKKIVVQADGPVALTKFQLVDGDGRSVFEAPLGKPEKVDHWKNWTFLRGEFSSFDKPGSYQARVTGPSGSVLSETFAVRGQLLPDTCLSDLLFYFKSQRSSGIHDRTDRRVPFFGGRRGTVDVHGGWFDASGDVSKYLSHLSYANYLNQQATPMVVWGLLQSAELLKDRKSLRLRTLAPMLADEALYGADFLVRMQDPSGYFYLSVFDGWSWDPAKRMICAYKTQDGNLVADYQAGLREGGGLTIAALARVAALKRDGDYPSARYLAAAEKGFAHLTANNLRYLDDHQENIIDDYCGLLAASELYLATHKAIYLQAARRRGEALVKRLHHDDRFTGFWRADADGKRPYFHAVEAGLPVVALLRYRAIEPDQSRQQAVLDAVRGSLVFELGITGEVANPFGYARQYVSDLGAGKRSAFFFPHRNESGYWWQGENARLGSMASAALLASRELGAQTAPALRRYAADQLDWILGLNPFDMCMLQGRGRRNPDLLPDNPNAPGGVCNGITSGFSDEHDIDFMPPPYDKDMHVNWRWAEQWLPHGAWLTLALAAQAAVND
jgi:hypothetical protein